MDLLRESFSPSIWSSLGVALSSFGNTSAKKDRMDCAWADNSGNTADYLGNCRIFVFSAKSNEFVFKFGIVKREEVREYGLDKRCVHFFGTCAFATKDNYEGKDNGANSSTIHETIV
jgi:hypothetical protein